MEHTTKYASLSLRMIAGLSDLAIHALLIVCGVYLVLIQATIKDMFQVSLLVIALILLNPLVLYHSILCLPLFGGSIGKLITGLRVVNSHHQFLSFKHAFFRQTVGYQFSAILLGLGFLGISKDLQRQGWHDKAIGSYVVIVHPHWYLGIVFSLVAFVLSGCMLYQGIVSFTRGPIPQEYKATYSSEKTVQTPFPTPTRSSFPSQEI